MVEENQNIKWDKIVIATQNKGKAKEFIEILAPFAKEIITLDQLGETPEVIEDGETFEENAIKKAETIKDFLQTPTIADDSGLMVDALQGAPGVYSARYSGPNATDQQNNEKLLNALNGVANKERTARFVSHIALAIPGKKTISVEDGLEGVIVEEPKGKNGFGYDPLFYIPSLGKTMAQLEASEKNKISHRAKAMKKLVNAIKENL